MKKCLWCGVETEYPLSALFSHFHLYSSGQWRYWRGNIKTFGIWDGFWSSVGLTFPIFNTLRHWKYRKAKLVLKP